MVVNRRIGHAMAIGVSEYNESPEALKRRLEDANDLIDSLRSRVKQLTEQVNNQQRTITGFQETRPAQPVVEHQEGRVYAGRPVGSQQDFANRNHCKPYQVSRWCARGQLEFVRIAGKYLVFLDQAAPGESPRGRKKKS